MKYYVKGSNLQGCGKYGVCHAVDVSRIQYLQRSSCGPYLRIAFFAMNPWMRRLPLGKASSVFITCKNRSVGFPRLLLLDCKVNPLCMYHPPGRLGLRKANAQAACYAWVIALSSLQELHVSCQHHRAEIAELISL